MKWNRGHTHRVVRNRIEFQFYVRIVEMAEIEMSLVFCQMSLVARKQTRYHWHILPTKCNWHDAQTPHSTHRHAHGTPTSCWKCSSPNQCHKSLRCHGNIKLEHAFSHQHASHAPHRQRKMTKNKKKKIKLIKVMRPSLCVRVRFSTLNCCTPCIVLERKLQHIGVYLCKRPCPHSPNRSVMVAGVEYRYTVRRNKFVENLHWNSSMSFDA